MPLPWGIAPDYSLPVLPVVAIPRAEDRAMTLQQFRDLREFVKRLCKINILSYPDDAYHVDVKGQRILWSKVNQYDICGLIIKRIIPQELSCSWTELVARGQPQEPAYFLSHWWGGSFRDFMAALEYHARERMANLDDGYWFCVAADDQWNVELGEKLQDSPFFRALRKSTSTLLMLDKGAQVRGRLWCVWEWGQTIELQHPITVGTSLGLVGSALVSSGPFVEALRSLCTSEATASDSVDLRRILNHIAGVSEMRGLKTGSGKDGTFALDPNFGPPGEYEAKLRHENHEQFEALDNRIQMHALAALKIAQPAGSGNAAARALDVGAAPGGCNVQAPESRSITLAQLRFLAAKVEKECADWTLSPVKSRIYPDGVRWRNVDLRLVKEFVIVPLTAERKCSYMEIIAVAPLRGEYFISGTHWDMKFKDLMSCIEWFGEARQLPDTATFWWDLLSIRQHDVETELGGTHGWFRGDQGLDRPAHRSVRNSSGVVVICDEVMEGITRIKNLYELYLATALGKTMDFLCPSGALAATRPFPEGCWEFGHFDPVIANLLVRIDCSGAKAKHQEDRQMVVQKIGGPDGKGMDVFNVRIRCKAAGPVLREADFLGDTGKLEEVLKLCPGIRLSSSMLQGSLGESALHMATSIGNLPALHYLLEQRADPNAQDSDGETPLHCAAFAAQADAMRCLFKAGADPTVESFYSETPLQVARQRPAFFAGLRYDEVEELLVLWLGIWRT